MARHLEGIDHCVVIVDDLAQAAETYARLGFMVSPLGRHDAEMGTGNRIILFERDYLELLGVLRPTHFNREIGQLAEMREGIAAIAAGVAAGEPQSVRRAVTLPDGSERDAEFTIA